MKPESEEKKAIRILWYLMFSPELVEEKERQWLKDWLNQKP